MLPPSQPLRCTSPAEVYMLLKSSDFVLHDLSADSVFEGCIDVEDGDDGDDRCGDGNDSEGHDGRRENGGGGARDARWKGQKAYELELVLRKWFATDPSREMRAFVRDGVLVGASSFFFSALLVLYHLLSPQQHTHAHTHTLCHRHREPQLLTFDRTRHLAARPELLRVSERALDAAQDRFVLRRALDDARQAKVDRPSVL